MIRRDFFSWIGKVSLALGLGYLGSQAKADWIEIPPDSPTSAPTPGSFARRMNGRACHDYRHFSDDRSILLDRDIFGG